MGRNAAKELERIVAKIAAYVGRAEHDPALALTYSAIEQATGVSRGHLSKRSDPEIVALVQRIALVKGARRNVSAASVADTSHRASLPAERMVAPTMTGVLANLPIDTLGQQVTREMRELARLQQQWLARHARSTCHDAPLALHDADDLLRRLRAAMERLRPLVGEWTRRHADVSAVPGTEVFEFALMAPLIDSGG